MLPQVLRGEICSLYLLRSENYVKLLQFGFLRTLGGEIFVSYVLLWQDWFFSLLCALYLEKGRHEGLDYG